MEIKRNEGGDITITGAAIITISEGVIRAEGSSKPDSGREAPREQCEGEQAPKRGTPPKQLSKEERKAQKAEYMRQWYAKNKKKSLPSAKAAQQGPEDEPVPARAYTEALKMSLRQWVLVAVEQGDDRDEMLENLLKVKGIRLIPREQVEKDLDEMLENFGVKG